MQSYRRFPALSISLPSKSFVNITFYEAENDNLLRQDIHHSSLYLLFDLLECQKSILYVKLSYTCSLTKFQRISKLTTPSPHSFLHKIKTSGVKIRPVLKKNHNLDFIKSRT